jgi:hypothetical protein
MLNSVIFYEYSVKCDLLENIGENFVVNFPGTQFQAQKASMNLLRKSGPLGHFWTRNLLQNYVFLPTKNWDDIGYGLG